MAAKKIKGTYRDTEIIYAHIPGGGAELCKERNFDRTYWMSDIYENLKNKPLGKIVYPGSHDAGSYNFQKPYEEVAGSNDILHDIRIHSVENYRLVQKHPIGIQLESGCRYFDLRIVRANNNNFYCQHSYVAESFSTILDQIKKYLDTGKNLKKRELIILDISGPSNNKNAGGFALEKDKSDLRTLINSKIGEYVYTQPISNAQRMTYSSFFDKLKPCVLLCGTSCYPEISFGEMACAKWPESSNNDDIIVCERESYYSYASRTPSDVYRMHFTSTYKLVDEFIPGNHQLDLTIDLNRKLCLLEDIMLRSLEDDKHLINILYLDSPATSPATVYARSMNLRLKYEPPKEPSVRYRAHVRNLGWLPWRQSGVPAGTVNRGLRMEAIEICLENAAKDASIEYKVFVHGRGWTDPVKAGQTAGTVGEWTSMKAVKIFAKGLSKKLMYRVYMHGIQDDRWSDWVSDGETAGDPLDDRIEAIEIKLV